MIFSEVWLPNIVCGLVSVGATLFMAKRINSKGAERSARVTDSILRMLAEMNRLELVNDDEGRPTGGKYIRLAGSAAGRATMTADLTTGPATMTAVGTVTPLKN
jgi:hypothetical protein